MNICVTGGAGFIGSHLTDRLIALGHRVVVIDNLSTGRRDFVNPKAVFVEMDIRDTKIGEVFKEYQIEYVFHQAAQTMVPVSMKYPDLDCDINLLGLINVLKACVSEGVKKIVAASSAAVYGDKEDLPLNEEEGGVPQSFYGLSKLTGESYLRLFEMYYGLSYLSLRYSNVYGPRQGMGGEGGVISVFCDRVSRGLPVTVFGDGTQTRDFIYVDDVVEANIFGITKESVTGVFNISSNTEISLRDLIAQCRHASGNEVVSVYENARKGDILHSRLCNEKAKKMLLWEAKTPLAEGLKKTYSYFKCLK